MYAVEEILTVCNDTTERIKGTTKRAVEKLSGTKMKIDQEDNLLLYWLTDGLKDLRNKLIEMAMTLSCSRMYIPSNENSDIFVSIF